MVRNKNQYESIYINYIVLHIVTFTVYILTPGNPKRDVCDVMLAVNHQPNFGPQIQVKSQCLQRQKYLQPWMFLDTWDLMGFYSDLMGY